MKPKDHTVEVAVDALVDELRHLRSHGEMVQRICCTGPGRVTIVATPDTTKPFRRRLGDACGRGRGYAFDRPGRKGKTRR
jgi:hypothetical protein